MPVVYVKEKQGDDYKSISIHGQMTIISMRIQHTLILAIVNIPSVSGYESRAT